MASGHVNRIKRPNTWLHRPMLQNVKKALANPEPSTHGTFRTSRDLRLESEIRQQAARMSAATCGNHSKCEDPGYRFAHPGYNRFVRWRQGGI